MQEKLYPIDLPPGFRNNGTTLQSRDRWLTGNLVRFFQGNKQPIGGWVQRTLTGATITGTPNASISWELSSGGGYLAIGTTTNLYVVDSSNVVYDITPTTVATDGYSRAWQLELFGSYLIAVYNVVGVPEPAGENVLLWAGDTAVPATLAYPVLEGPIASYGVVVTPERFLVILRGQTPVAHGDWATRKEVSPGLPSV